jgi:hypothetical protein
MGISRVLDNNMQKKSCEFVVFWLIHIIFGQIIGPAAAAAVAAAAAAAAAAICFTLPSMG